MFIFSKTIYTYLGSVYFSLEHGGSCNITTFIQTRYMHNSSSSTEILHNSIQAYIKQGIIIWHRNTIYYANLDCNTNLAIIEETTHLSLEQHCLYKSGKWFSLHSFSFYVIKFMLAKDLLAPTDTCNYFFGNFTVLILRKKQFMCWTYWPIHVYLCLIS